MLGSLGINKRWRHLHFQFLDHVRYKSEDVASKFCKMYSVSSKYHVVVDS